MIKDFIHKEFLTDRLVMSLAIASIVLALFNLISVLFGVQQSDFSIAVRYTQYSTSPLVLGAWWNLYELALFSLFMPLVNIVLGVRLHRFQRPLAIGLLLFTILMLFYLFLVTRAVLGLQPES